MLSNVHDFHRLYFLKVNPILLSEKVFLKVLNMIFLSILIAKIFKFILLKVTKNCRDCLCSNFHNYYIHG
jgi:hypothetical protein